MPLTLEELEDIQADAMADDVKIELERMSLWSKEEAEAYFESGGEVEPIAAGRGGVQPKVSGPPVVVSWFSGGMTPEQGRSQLKSWSAAVKAAGLTDHIVVDPPTERVPPPANLSEYLTSLVSEIDDEPSRRGRPILLFGHSHGALWAYALAAHLGERACRLVVAARRPPSAPVLDVWGVASAAEFAALSDETVLRSMVTAWPNRMLEQIVPFPASEWPAWATSVMRIVRRQYGDSTIGLGASDWDGCAAQRLPALRCHVLAVAAADEKPGGETAERMEAWGVLVGPGGRFEMVTVPGGHLDMMQPAKGPKGPPPPIFELSLAGLQHVA